MHLVHSRLIRKGEILPTTEVGEIASALKLQRTARTITYCQSGIRAAHTALCLAAAGFDDIAVYDGSMVDYLNATDYPVSSN